MSRGFFSFCLRTLWTSGHHRRASVAGPGTPRSEVRIVEMAVGIVLVIVSGLLIAGIIRTVSANAPR